MNICFYQFFNPFFSFHLSFECQCLFFLSIIHVIIIAIVLLFSDSKCRNLKRLNLNSSKESLNSSIRSFLDSFLTILNDKENFSKNIHNEVRNKIFYLYLFILSFQHFYDRMFDQCPFRQLPHFSGKEYDNYTLDHFGCLEIPKPKLRYKQSN